MAASESVRLISLAIRYAIKPFVIPVSLYNGAEFSQMLYEPLNQRPDLQASKNCSDVNTSVLRSGMSCAIYTCVTMAEYF